MAEVEHSFDGRNNSIESHLNGIHESEGSGADGTNCDRTDETKLNTIIKRVRDMEEDTENLSLLQNEMEKEMNLASPARLQALSLEEKVEADSRSVYVGNVDYGATAEELEHHFHACGPVNRVTILCDKYSGHPKGFAYIEFSDKNSVEAAMMLDESMFRGRQIKVMRKRTNRPGISSTNRPPRNRFRRNLRGRIIYRSPMPNFRGART